MEWVNNIGSVAFEEYLADQWAVNRKDLYKGEILPLEVLRNCQPVRPSSAARMLNVTNDQLVRLLQSGKAPRPGKLGHGRVAWRADELAMVSQWLSDIRE